MATVTMRVYLTEAFKQGAVPLSATTFIEALRSLVAKYPVLKGVVLTKEMKLKRDYITCSTGKVSSSWARKTRYLKMTTQFHSFRRSGVARFGGRSTIPQPSDKVAPYRATLKTDGYRSTWDMVPFRTGLVMELMSVCSLIILR